MDRNSQSPAIVASTEGGVEIEEVAKTNPDAVKVYPIGLETGITAEILNKLETDLKLQKVPGFRDQVKNLYKMFCDCDAVQVEINPWAVNPKNEVYSVDAKISID